LLRSAVALAALAGAPLVSAQVHLSADVLIGYSQRPDAVSCTVVRAHSSEAVHDDLIVHLPASWPDHEIDVRTALATPTVAPRLVVVPVPIGPFANAEVRLGTQRATVSPGRTARGEGPLTHVAVIGLGQRIAARLCTVSEGLECGALASSELSGEPMLPGAPFAWGGTQVALLDAEALFTLSPTARGALDAWVRQGGVAVVALRSARDRTRLGAWAEGPAATLDLGEAWARGLGAVVAVELDLSSADWDEVPGAAPRFATLAHGLAHVGAAMSPPGTLTLYRRATDRNGPLREVWRSPFNTRTPLGVMAAVLALYVIAVGVLLTRNRRAAAPLQMMVRLPLGAFVVLAATFATTWLSRTRQSEARVVALYDLAAGGADGTERVFASITAGGARALTLRPPAGHLTLLHTSAASTGGWLRWDGGRLSVEGARLGLWETASLYTEGPAALGGGITLARDASGRPRVHNGTPLALGPGGVLDRDGVTVWPVPAVAAGAEVIAGDAEVRVGGDNTRRLFGSEVGAATSALQLFDEVLGSVGGHPGPMQYFTTAAIPAPLATRMRALGVVLTQTSALLRVVDTRFDAEHPMMPRARLDHAARTPDPRQTATATERTAGDAAVPGDGSVDTDAPGDADEAQDAATAGDGP